MKFGKEFSLHLEKTLPEWREYYLSYKLLKKLLKNIPAAAAAPLLPLPELQVWFVAILCVELEKFNDFYVEKEEVFVIRFQALKERIEGLLDAEFTEEIMEIRRECVALHGEMVLLKSYSTLNFVGLVKILKKFDKRTGTWLGLPFIHFAFHQPFFSTELLTTLIGECEEILEILFPVVAEVVGDEQTGMVSSDASSLWLGEETIRIYNSTLGALSAIEGLRRESSTYNPLSMSNVFGSPDNGSTGGVTAENSPRHN
ncbi:SPX domain-containing protein 4-like [Andrographis paniculata]|uniref:SPX domain-containing protein 4-like n=1 Tax=Andrographis paniculata TaxID=175694 RepID=UPI0021E74762|nr:SPX domain-containing protein 4-like [Andrographis paniculata]XP_051119488.1 SPX domain-containing protein 4-like [Andrographis paniculata]